MAKDKLRQDRDSETSSVASTPTVERVSFPDRQENGESTEFVDRLVILRRRYCSHSTRASFLEDQRLLGWISAQARTAAESGITQAWPNDRVLSVAQSLQATTAAAKASLPCIPGWPEYVNGREAACGIESDHRGGFRAAPYLDLAVAAGRGRDLWDEDCENWIVLPDSLPNGRYVALGVFGESMEPLLHAGDKILVHLTASFKVGAIVVARSPDGFVVKRLRKVAAGSIHLDPINPAFPRMSLRVVDQPLVGNVVLRWCGHSSSTARARRL